MTKAHKVKPQSVTQSEQKPLAIVENTSQLPKIPTIGVYVPTRNRQHLCVSTLNAWSELSADPANIKYLMGIDYDDESSAKIIPGDGLKVHTFDKDVISCGGRNKALSDKLDVDIYLCINDYYYPMSQYWDNTLRHAMMSGGVEVCAMQFAPNPQALHVTACSKRWMQYANKFEPQLFPFWFSDQWRIETHCYVFGKAPPVVQQLQVGCRQSGTQNLREFEFWWGFFTALRPLRLRQAYEIYQNYGLTAPSFEEFVSLRRNWIDDFALVDATKRKQAAEYEASIGDRNPPGEKYLRCKANAEKMIKDENLKLWVSGI